MGALSRVSLRTDGTEASSTGDSILVRGVSISADGRFVGFMSPSNDLADLDPSGNGVFVRDRDITEDFQRRNRNFRNIAFVIIAVIFSLILLQQLFGGCVLSGCHRGGGEDGEADDRDRCQTHASIV